MKKGLLRSFLFLGFASMFSLQGCIKEPLLENNSVVKFPYSLYASKEDGTIIHTNNGEHFRLVFPTDGFAPSQIVIAGNNLLIAKQNLHMSTNDGKSFNPVLTNLRKFPWGNAVFHAPAHNATFAPTIGGHGVSISNDYGATWQEDVFEQNAPMLKEIGSFAQLDNGKVFCYSNISNIAFRKDSKESVWSPVTSVSSIVTTNNNYYMTGAGSTLMLTDYTGVGGVWFSENEGYSWTNYTRGDLPFDTELTGTISPYGNRICVVATRDKGIYRSDAEGIFRNASVGLEQNTIVHTITKKTNVYKNDAVKVYLYAATSTGMYCSEDGGRTWYKVTFSQYEGKYVSLG